MTTNKLSHTTAGHQFSLYLNDRILFSAKVCPATPWCLTTRTTNNKTHTLWLYQGNRPVYLYQTENADLISEVQVLTTQVMKEISPRLAMPRSVGLALIFSVMVAVSASTVLLAEYLRPEKPAATQIIGVPVDTPATLPAAVPAADTVQAVSLPAPASLSEAEMKEAQQLLAFRLKTAAAKKDFTVTLSSGHARTLYLFADPECSNCRIFEPTIQALARSYNVEIFPITLVGKARTAERVVPLLCSTPELRPQLWRELFDIGAGILTPKADASASCDGGYDVLARNDMAFDMFGLPGTPTVISDDGRMIPLQAMTSETALQTFLEQAL